MKRVATSRRNHTGLLRRPPPLDQRAGAGAATVRPRRVDEVRQLLGLVDRGLLSDEEFERQVLRVLGTSSGDGIKR